MFLFFPFGAAHIVNLPAANGGIPEINPAKLTLIALAFGFSLVVNVWIFARVSGSLFNPAISLSLGLTRVITPIRAILVSIAQLLGGITAAALVEALTPGPLNVGTRLGGGISVSQGNRLTHPVLNFRVILGNVFDIHVDNVGAYARSRKARIDFHSSDGDRIYFVCGSFVWGLLHWGVP